MSERATIRLSVEWPGLSFETFGWPEFRELMEHVLKAAAAMPEGPAPGDVIPVRVDPGSIVPALKVPRPSVRAFHTLRAGPKRTWTPRQRQAAEPFYEYLRQKQATMKLGQRKLKLVTVPDPEFPKWEIRERCEQRAKVLRVGGDPPRVRVRFRLDGAVVCEADHRTAKGLAVHLYEEVVLEGLRRLDPHTGALIAFQITGFRPSRRLPLKEGHRRLLNLVGDDTAGLDVAAVLEQRRRE